MIYTPGPVMNFGGPAEAMQQETRGSWLDGAGLMVAAGVPVHSTRDRTPGNRLRIEFAVLLEFAVGHLDDPAELRLSAFEATAVSGVAG
jgi:hypothetical protein